MSLTHRFRTRFRRFLERPGSTVDLGPMREVLPDVAAREDDLAGLDDADLTAAAGEATDLVEICAIGREAGRRALGERAYDEQLLGVMALLAGDVAEMATGEGKTLAAAIAAYGHVRRGNGPVHVITVNDYLARRDAEWMAPVYDLLGLTVGWVAETMPQDRRRDAYGCDVTYASVSEAGFDFLRDRLVHDPDERVQRPLATAIVDEADSILVDEAKVPLVLAGTLDAGQDPLQAATALVASLREGIDYEIAGDGRSAALTGDGTAVVEHALGDIDLYAEEHAAHLFAVNVALHARALVHRDVDYIVRDGKVELVDEFRGRIANRRRWPDGLQAAVEAKEGLVTTADGEVMNTITVQSFLRRYRTVCGMTATAVLVGEQLREFFSLEVAVIPRHRPLIRTDEPDRLYASRQERDATLATEIIDCHASGRPVLVGTLDVKESETLAAALREAGVPCVVLNAKNDAQEAAIIAEAGTYGRVTVSTQMAGRGVDIRLGGSDQSDADRVSGLGGLYVIGCGRHDSRRVDDQLRGRAGRQGDPGGSVFFVSLEDELVVRHAADMIPPSPTTHADGLVADPRVAEAVEHAQRVAEGVTFEVHRNTWRYHFVVEQQRQELAAWREELLTTDAAADLVRQRRPELAEKDQTELVRIARAVALHEVDRAWTAHLAFLAEVREGVHLRALGRLDPLDEFHRAAVPAFGQLREEVSERIAETVADADISPDWQPADAQLLRPSATWTYLVTDNPFGSELERLFSSVSRRPR